MISYFIQCLGCVWFWLIAMFFNTQTDWSHHPQSWTRWNPLGIMVAGKSTINEALKMCKRNMWKTWGKNNYKWSAKMQEWWMGNSPSPHLPEAICMYILNYILLCYVMLCYIVLCYVILCYVILYYAMLCFNILYYILIYYTYIYIHIIIHIYIYYTYQYYIHTYMYILYTYQYYIHTYMYILYIHLNIIYIHLNIIIKLYIYYIILYYNYIYIL